MMKRYEEFGCDAEMKETIDGEWVKFTDHQAEIDRRDALLKRVFHFAEQQILRNEFDIHAWNDLCIHVKAIAQKDSTQ